MNVPNMTQRELALADFGYELSIGVPREIAFRVMRKMGDKPSWWEPFRRVLWLARWQVMYDLAVESQSYEREQRDAVDEG